MKPTTRLNKSIREQIVANALIKSGLAERKAKLKGNMAEWSEEVRKFAVGFPEEQILKMEEIVNANLDKIPHPLRKHHRVSLAYRRSSLHANIAGRRVFIEFKDEKGYDDYRICPYEMHSGIPADHPLAKRFVELEKEKDEVNDKIESLKAQVLAVLESVTTVKRLLEAWPEAAELLPKEAAAATTTLPAVKVDALNNLIGLPTQEAA